MQLKTSISLFFLLFISGIQAQELPPNFTREIVEQGFNRLAGLCFDEAGRGFSWTKFGVVYRLDEHGVRLPAPLLDLSEEVADWADMGLLGCTLDPQFEQNGHFYLLYIVDRHHLLHFGTPAYDPNLTLNGQATIGRITRYTADPSSNFTSIVPNSRKILLGETKETGFPVLYSTHGVGSLAFGTDGTLLASFGEMGFPDATDLGWNPATYYQQAMEDGILRLFENVGAFRAQLLDCLGGKIIRIHSETGDGLPGNPFYEPARPHSQRSKVWALGFRNPYRFVIKPNSGSHFSDDDQPGILYVGDVGANAWEEVNIVTGGGQNFGWPLWEGFQERSDFMDAGIKNFDSPNPLFNQNGCGQDFFLFTDLLRQPLENGEPAFPNPCDAGQVIPSEIPVFVHHPPAIAYRNKDVLWQAQTVTGSFDGTGKLFAQSIDSAGVKGSHFWGVASIGGLFLEGEAFPEQYRQRYLHTDFSGWMQMLDFSPTGHPLRIEPFYSDTLNIVSPCMNPADGCLYFLDIKYQALYKICYGGKPAPLGKASVDRYFGASPLEIQFEGNNSVSPFQSPLTFHWDFGDGQTANETNPSHIFFAPSDAPTSFEVQLTVTDTLGQSGTAKLLISLNNTPPEVHITSLPDSALYDISTTTLVRLAGKAMDAEHPDEQLTYEWRTYLHHDTHVHPDLVSEAPSAFAQISPLGCGNEPYWYRIELTVSDPVGLSGTATRWLFPYCGEDYFSLQNLVAEPRHRSVELSWNTLFETNLAGFEVERGKDIFSFEPIGIVAAKNATGSSRYAFVDPQPIRGTNFYRLKINGLQNAFSYSEVVSAAFAASPPNVQVFPNPAVEMLNIGVEEVYSERLVFKLFHADGSLVWLENWQATPGIPFLRQVKTAGLAAGTYFYELQNGAEKSRGLIAIL